MHRHKLTPESDSFLTKHLEQRKNQNAIRQLSSETSLIDFCSNDYLGFARSRTLMEKIRTSAAAPGSTGSRLISGNSMLCEDLERTIAEFHQAPAGLIFNSGFDANLGLLSSVARRGDTILYDELVHASIRDGIRLSFAKSFPFSHNNIAHLEARLRRARGELFVAVESVYSMDGDCAPLPDMANVCDQFGAHLIIDEAHATGVFGPGGRGLVVQEDLAARVFARVHTFGKALGSHGAIVLGSAALRSYLINFARSFIYTTALPPHSLRSIRASYQFLHEAPDIIETLRARIHAFRNALSSNVVKKMTASDSPIQCMIVPGNDRVKALAETIQKGGYDVRPILSPTVPAGKERLRICLHAFNEPDDVRGLCEVLNTGMAGL